MDMGWCAFLNAASARKRLHTWSVAKRQQLCAALAKCQRTSGVVGGRYRSAARARTFGSAYRFKRPSQCDKANSVAISISITKAISIYIAISIAFTIAIAITAKSHLVARATPRQRHIFDHRVFASGAARHRLGASGLSQPLRPPAYRCDGAVRRYSGPCGANNPLWCIEMAKRTTHNGALRTRRATTLLAPPVALACNWVGTQFAKSCAGVFNAQVR